jgi:PAS domain S-box-containing protein
MQFTQGTQDMQRFAPDASSAIADAGDPTPAPAGDALASMAAENSVAMLEALLDSIPDFIAYKDASGRYLGCNAAFSRMCGRSPAELRGKSVLDIFPPERAKPLWEHERAVMNGLCTHAVEEEIVQPDGSRVCVEIVRSPLRAADGTVLGLLSIGRDITQRKKSEEEVRRAKEIAEEATRMKSDFLANMSHEIRTPMNAIIGLSHLVLKTELSERQRDYLGKVQASGQHLLRVIDDILDFSKVEAGKLDLEHAPFDLQALLDNTRSLLGDKSDAKGLPIRVEVAADVPRHLVGDSLRLGQILLNYANNAIKFTERGEIVISVAASEISGHSALLRFCVRDTGIGLTSQQIGKLFQSFSQADTSTTRKFGGTGLGLAICSQLAALMGGEVGVESEYGKGSTFWFSARLGVGRGSPAGQLHGGAPAPPERGSRGMPAPSRVAEHLRAIGGRRILLVEDNDINQQVAREMLQDTGLAVEVAENGQVALAMVQASSYDLVFMDMQMPVMDGIAATRELRKLERCQALPIVAMTANAMAQDRARCLDAGMNDFLVKPIDPGELSRILVRWLPREAAGAISQPAPAAGGLPQGIGGLDTALGLSRMGGKKTLYLAMLRRYASSQKNAAADIRRALAAGDLATARDLAHTSKGVSGTLGVVDVQHHAGALEEALRESRAAQAQELLAPFEAALGPLIAALEAQLPQ